MRRWSLQAIAARAVRFIPDPPALERLRPLREAAAAALLAPRRAELERAWSLDAAGDPRGRAAYRAIAGELVAAHREAVLIAAAAAGPWTSAAARLDALLPTDATEHVDDPALPDARRVRVIDAVDRFNRLLGSYRRFLELLRPMAPGDRATVLDVASGHGGFPIALASTARAEGLSLRVIASDLRPEYLAAGQARARREGLDVEFRVLDALRLATELAPGEVDVITCTQSLHHFDASMVAGLLAEALRAAPHVLFVDPVRAVSALVGAGALSIAGTLDPVFVHDAWVSVRRSFVAEELGLIARCVPGGERVEAIDVRPGFVALRTRPLSV